MRLACGYNHHIYTGELLPHNDVCIIELGFKAYNTVFLKKALPRLLEKMQLSLHISRSPITESMQCQDSFIDEKLLGLKEDKRIISIGFHLCGDRSDNIGQFGFSSHYNKNEGSENNAIQFLKKVRQYTEKDVWLENANFYSSSVNEIIQNWKSFNHIVKESGAGSIIDLSHLIIDCQNNGICPSMMIGFIDWESVVEIHLSGIVIGKDGSFHDGHGSQVHDLVWVMLENLLKAKLIDDSVIYNIEHSDGNWLEKIDIYNNDFEKLKGTLGKNFSEGERNEKSKEYATLYLKKLLIQEVENIEEISEFFKTSTSDLLNEWIEHIMKIEKRIALSIDDMDSLISNKSIHFTQSFADFIEKKQQ